MQKASQSYACKADLLQDFVLTDSLAWVIDLSTSGLQKRVGAAQEE